MAACMNHNGRRPLAACAGFLVLACVSRASAQVPRYEPSKPTVSPYLNLFREDNDAGALPNYQSLVRPLQRQHAVNQAQQQILQQQTQVIQQLELNIEGIQQQRATGALIAPTGQGSWFMRPSSRSAYFNTSRYYSQAGGPLGQPPGGARRSY